MCNPNYVEERKKSGGKNHGNIILLGSIKYFDNFGLKISLTTCQTQIKFQILTQKKIILNSFVYVSYDMYDAMI